MSEGPAAPSSGVAKQTDRRSAALAAAEARLRGPVGEGTSTSSSASLPSARPEPTWTKPTEKQDIEAKKTFARLLDRGIIRDNGYKQSAAAVEILLKIANNILSHPDDPKYREIKSTNPALANKVASARGGHEYLIAMGFRTRTINFEQFYNFQPSMKRMHELEIGAQTLQEHLTHLQNRANALAASTVYSASDEAERKARALREIEADRDIVRTRVERERLGREYRETVQNQPEEHEIQEDPADEEREAQGTTWIPTQTAKAEADQTDDASTEESASPPPESSEMDFYRQALSGVQVSGVSSGTMDDLISSRMPSRRSRNGRNGDYDPFPPAETGRKLGE